MGNPSSDVGVDTHRDHSDQQLHLIGLTANVAGLGYVWLVVAGHIILQYEHILDPPRAWLMTCGLAAIPVIAVALASRRIGRATAIIGAMIFAWLSSGALSSLALTGATDTRSLLFGLIAAGLFFGVAGARPAWSGWSIFILGSGWLLANIYAYYRSYYSLGQEFPYSTLWATTPVSLSPSMSAITDWRGLTPLPFPDGVLARVWALLVDVPGMEALDAGFKPFIFTGLTTNGNQTGAWLTPFLAFVVPFLRQRWQALQARRPNAAIVARIGVAAAVLIPGLFMLYMLEARAAIGAVLAGLVVLLIPSAWLRSRGVAIGFVLTVPAIMLIPFTTGVLMGRDWSGRACIWDQVWLPSIQGSPWWGFGPPGRLPNVCLADGSEVFHAHNELLQAWSIGGLLGLIAATAALCGLAWFAVRYWQRDGRILMAVLICCAVLMGFDVLTSYLGNFVHLGIVWLLVVAGRSMALLEPTETATT